MVVLLYSRNTTARIHIHNTNISGNIVNNNERTNTRLYKNILRTLAKGLRKGWCWLCVRGELETETDCYILTTSSSDHSSTSFAFWLGCSTVGPWGPKALRLPLALNSASCPQLTPTATGTRNDRPKPSVAPGYIIVWHPPAPCGRTHLHRIQPRPQVKVILRYIRPETPVSLFSCLFTQMHLLIDGSFEGQYVTVLFNP